VAGYKFFCGAALLHRTNPKSNLQIPGKLQGPKIQKTGARGFGILELVFLDLPGVWDFACNLSLALAVIVISVDTIWTWMILTLMRWFKPRFGMTMRRLANWCADSIRLSRKWCGPIGRDELLRRISAK
jgi:hypothetical protein